MSRNEEPPVTQGERESLKVAEAAREKQWKAPSFLKEMFLGNFRLDLIHPFPTGGADRPEFVRFYQSLRTFLLERVDPVAIDATGEYPREVVDGLARMGAFGMKIPAEYGGLGFTQLEYSRIMELVGSVDGNLCALLSAHQSIGVPQPLKIFGTKEQKSRFLPRCAAGALSAFALTEERAGYKRLALDVREAADEELRQASEIVRVSREERDQQREDIRRLVKMAEDVRAMPGAGRELLALLSEMKERYDA